MDRIAIEGLTVFYRVGVPDAERAQTQRLELTVEMGCDVTEAASADDVRATIDYHAVCQRLLRFGEGRSWRLIETLAVEIANVMLREFGAAEVLVEVRKFIIPEARHVAIRIFRRARSEGESGG